MQHVCEGPKGSADVQEEMTIITCLAWTTEVMGLSWLTEARKKKSTTVVNERMMKLCFHCCRGTMDTFTIPPSDQIELPRITLG
jgi:hypothetical protein